MSAPDRTATANFLASLDGLTYQEAVANCEADKASYGWSHETSGAIREGIVAHFTPCSICGDCDPEVPCDHTLCAPEEGCTCADEFGPQNCPKCGPQNDLWLTA